MYPVMIMMYHLIFMRTDDHEDIFTENTTQHVTKESRYDESESDYESSSLNSSMMEEWKATTLFAPGGEPSDGERPLLNRKAFRARRVSITEHPYIVSIRRNISHYLTGSLVTENLVLTVAHAVYKVPVYELGVVAGENYSDRGTTILTVLMVITHGAFNPNTLDRDVALLRLYEDLKTRINVKIVQRPSDMGDLEGSTGFITGWGRCDYSTQELCLPRGSHYYPGEIQDPMLRSISVTIAEPDTSCDDYSKFGIPMHKDKSLCAGTARQNDSAAPCLAVPGAPLVVEGKVLGVLSFGFSCGYEGDLPMVFVNVLQISTWLERNFVIQRGISREQLGGFYNATRGFYITNLLQKSGYGQKLKANDEDVHVVNVLMKHPLDEKLCELDGEMYDIRDFIYHGNHHFEKQRMYRELLALRPGAANDSREYDSPGYVEYSEYPERASEVEYNDENLFDP